MLGKPLYLMKGYKKKATREEGKANFCIYFVFNLQFGFQKKRKMDNNYYKASETYSTVNLNLNSNLINKNVC